MRFALRQHGTVERLEPRAYLVSTGAAFGNPRLFTAGAGAAYVAVADFDANGRLDIASANVQDGTISVIEGDGRGRFGSHQAIPPVGQLPRSLAVADFNGDDRLDALTTFDATATVAVQTGTGNGTFIHPATESPYGRPGAGGDAPDVHLADFNSDAHLDVVLIHPADHALSILLGNGDATFQPPRRIELNAPTAVAAGDFNRDGRPDLIGASGSDGVVVFSADADEAGRFNRGEGISLTGVTELHVADLNGDGFADVLAGSAAGLSVLLGRGDGTFQVPFAVDAAGGAADVVVADFNGDAKADVAVAHATSPNGHWLAGNGDGTFDPPALVPAEGPARTVAAADFDGNGKTDLVFGHHDGSGVSVVLNGKKPDGDGGGGGGGGGPEPPPVDPTVDLVPVLSAKLPAAAVAGRKTKARVVLTLFNDGNSTTSGPVTIELFASPDTALDGADVLITTVTKKLKVKGGKSKVVRLKLGALPATLPGGSYRVVARVGMPETTETDTNNNVASSREALAVEAAPGVG